MQGAGTGKKNIVLILAVIASTILMDGLDGSIVNIALPALASDFGTDTGTIAWVSTIYLVMLAGLLITFARIAKNGMIKRVLVIGLIIFTASSLLCGISTSFEMLLVFRALQGIGAAMMGAAVPMACVRYLPAANLGLGMGVLTLGFSLGFALGPVVGGILTDLLSWHWIFLINVPIGLLIILLAVWVIPKDEGYAVGQLDIAGAVLLFSAILCGIFAIERIPHQGSVYMVVPAAIGCIIFLAAFIFIERRKMNPLLNLRVFRHWKFNSVLLAYLLANLTYMGMLYMLPFYMEVCMGFSPYTSGLYIFISPLLTLLLCVPMAIWSDRTERRAFSVTACAVLAAGGLILFLFGADSLVLPLVAALVCMGLTWALCGGPMASRIIENTEDESKEVGSSIMAEAIYLGSALGMAVFAMLFVAGSGSGNISFSDLPKDVFLDGFLFSMAAATVIAAAAAVLSFIVKEPKRYRT
ncbi:MAG: MFS transporter [Candidatus Methanoplasma sp.]|jgi:EmrB/QacA subfamily drug resistance transporter|nr:MFS transporter [Candidatus Methanoplasma sp.]